MSPERWKQIEEVFQAALDLAPGAERRALIDEACADDDDLRAQVEALVAQHDEAGDFIELPAFTGFRTSGGTPVTSPLGASPDGNFVTEDPAIGRRIGAYRIEREIGRGGMGAVYLAERADGGFRQRAAIKLIKRGMDTDFILRRFRNERQILATLDHPHIARLMDGGTTSDGLPYFVMEYIEGLPLYRYCDERKLTIPERLRIFRHVCDAVHYAHKQLVIHRDIKPSNILVTPEGVPKLLDFGIAKLLNPELAAEITLDPTATAMRLMTPEYASPEQVQGLPVTPASDIYSLGVLLYETLTGHRPYRLRQRAPHEIARVICEEEPAHPSVRITSLEDLLPAHPSAAGDHVDTLSYLYWSRGASVDSLRRELTGNLDSIVMKALRKEPEERYASVEHLREDITRHLDGRAVSAPLYFPSAASAQPHQSQPPIVPDDDGNSLAVLPLKLIDPRHGEETGEEYLCVGLADALITRLGSIRRFAVRPTSSVLRYGSAEADPLEAGRALNVGFVLDGRIRRAGEQIRVTVQLLDVRAGGATRWAGQFDEQFTDVLSLEDAISSQVAEALVPQLTGGERRLLAKRGTDNAEAFEAYMRGRYYWNTFTEEGLARALVCYNQAVAHAPDYALAYTGIADYYNWLGVYAVLPFAETSAAAKDAALKAIALDDTLAEAYSALGFATLMSDFDWAATEQHLRRGIKLNPNYVTGRLWYCYYLGMKGHSDEALTQARRALELDPLTPFVRQTLSWSYYHARRYDESIAVSRKLAADEPRSGLTHVFLCLALSRIGQYEESVEAGIKAISLLGRSPYTLAWLALAHASAGHADEARALLEEIARMAETRYVSPYLVAMIHSNLGDAENAFAELERALAIRDGRLAWLGVDPQFDPLHADPRYARLLRETNNPAATDQRRRAPSAHDSAASLVSAAAEPSTGVKSVAVLPLRVLGHVAAGTGAAGDTNTGEEYLGLGLADALITRLSNVPRFVVRPTNSVLRYQTGDADPLEAGRELGVDYVVSGNVRRAGERIRVTAQLFSVAEGATRWAGKFDESSTDVLQLEDSISAQVANALVPQLTGYEQRQLQKRGTDNPEAYEVYLRGRYYWNTMTEDGFGKAITCFYRAAALDPSYAAAYAGVAEYHCWLAVYGLAPPAASLTEARRAAARAVELDDTLAEAHTAHGLALLSDHSQWEVASRRFRRALELNPNYATAHVHYACQLGMEGRFDESVTEARRAVALDPLNPFNSYILAWCLYQARRYDEGIAQSRALLESEPRYGSARFVMSWMLRRIGEHEEAVAEAKKALELLGEIPMFCATLGAAYAEAGREEEARGVLDGLTARSAESFVTPYHRALLHLRLGERTRALDLLEESLDASDPWVVWLGVEPQLDELRAEPRFDELLRRTNNPAFTAARREGSTGEDAGAPSSSQQQQSAPATAAAAAKPRPTEDEEAYQLYVAGRYYETRRTAEGLRQAIERYERAVVRDPGFALAYAELADCYSLLNFYVEPPPVGAWAHAKEAALKAVAADESLAEAHASLGFVLCNHDHDFEGAERELRRALELQPDTTVARRWHAFNLSAMGRHAEAVAEIKRAQEISPRSAVTATAFANILFFAGRFDEAVEQCRRALELDPGSIPTHIILRWSYEMKGMRDEALAVYEQERAFAGDTPTTRAKRAHVLAACGRTAEAREILEELIVRRDEEWVTAYEVAVVFAFLGEPEEAFAWLAHAEEENAVGLTYLRVDPRLNSLRADSRFGELLLKLQPQTRVGASPQEEQPALQSDAPSS